MKTFLLIAIAVLGGSTLILAESEPTAQSLATFTTEVGPCFRRPNGFARDVNDCRSYFICENGQTTRGRCPGNLAFDAENEQCWWREEVTCFQCPRDQFYAMLPVAGTCHQFYRCWQGQATIHTCPNELVFDSNLRACNFVTGSGCAGDQTIANRCPAVNGPEPVLLPAENSCSSYFLCFNGDALPRQCPPGLHFNPILRICDLPENAHCMINENPWEDEIWGEGIGIPGIGGIDQNVAKPCPVSGHAFVPHRSNCNAYFACSNQLPTLVNCAPGLHFDFERETCDRPQNARCWSHVHQPSNEPMPIPMPFGNKEQN